MFNVIRFNRNIRTIRRFRFILSVFVKYGFDDFLDYVHLSKLAGLRRRFLKRNPELVHLLPPQRLRLAFEELGATFIKLGQLLSTRPDVIPRSFTLEFAHLQDNVPSISYEEARGQIRLELGADVEDLFCRFDEEPLAAASIAQVHRARMCSGEEVVVKIRRPGVTELVETDIDVLMMMAQWLERHLPGSHLYDPVGVVREFSHVIRREMDLAREGHTIEKFAQNFAEDRDVYFPKIHWEATSRGVLTMEYIDGIKVSDLEALDRAGMDRRLIASRGATFFLKQVLQCGFFHGDPHPGNVFILPDNVICLLDYGMVGRMDRQMRDFLSSLLYTILDRNVDELIDLLIDAGEVTDNLNTRRLKRDLTEFIDSYYEIPFRDLSVGRMLMNFFEIITTHRMKLDPDFMLLCKALVNIEGMGRDLDPGFDMLRHMRPFVEREVRQRLDPSELFKEARGYFMSVLHLTKNLPRDLREIVNRINRDKFKIDLEHRGLDRFINELDRSINRLSSSLVIAALAVSSSILAHYARGPMLFGFPIISTIGYVGAGLLGFWLIVGILRSGRL